MITGRINLTAGAALLGLLLLCPRAHAGEIVYTVDQTVNSGSITGTITTDGTLGTLAASDIVAWQLDMNDGSNTNTESDQGAGAGVIFSGSALSATLTTLSFNYSAGDGSYVGFDIDNGAEGSVCITSTSNCFGPAAIGTYNVDDDSSANYVQETGTLVIAADGVPVPEPTTLGLFTLGLAALRFAKRRTSASA